MVRDKGGEEPAELIGLVVVRALSVSRILPSDESRFGRVKAAAASAVWV